VAAVGVEQELEGGADRQRNAQHVGVDHRLPMLRRLRQKPPGGTEAGVREHRVDAPEADHGRLDDALDVAPVRDIASSGQRAIGPSQLSPELVEFLLAPGA
jgi:hypothetical protein